MTLTKLDIRAIDTAPRADFDSQAAFESADIPVTITAVFLSGYYAPGDGGEHMKVRIATPVPVELWHSQSADGAWWQVSVRTGMHPRMLGAVGDGTANDGPELLATIAYCKAFDVGRLRLDRADFLVDGLEAYIDFPLDIIGDNREGTRVIFTGSPTKTKRTRVVWKAAYDTGDYSSASDDEAIACGFIFADINIRMTDVTVVAKYTVLANYPLPFNSATDYPTSNYDVGILILYPNCILERVETVGPWGNFGPNGGLRIDDTVSGSCEHIRIRDSVFRGRWGVSLTGPLGQPTGGENHADMLTADTRGGGGWSDTTFDNVECYDTGIRLTIDGNANRRVKRLASTGGALYINGQISLNTSKRQQQLTFKRCRFANIDEYTYYVNYANRVTMLDCHTEYVSGSYIEDGVTPQTSADNQGRWITANARQTLISGGEYSGETDNVIRTGSGLRLVTERDVSKVDGRYSTGGKSGERLPWTPTVIGSGGGSATIGQAFGWYERNNGTVNFGARIQLSAVGTLTGNVIIGGFPFAHTNQDVFADAKIDIMTSLVTVGDAGVGAIMANGASQIDLYKVRSAASLQNIGLADIVATSSFWIGGSYVTDDP